MAVLSARAVSRSNTNTAPAGNGFELRSATAVAGLAQMW